MVPGTFLGLKFLLFTFSVCISIHHRGGLWKRQNWQICRWSIQYWDRIRGSGRYGATYFPLTSNTLWLNLKIIEEDKHVGLEYPGDEALPVTASRDLWCLWLDCGCALSPCDLCLFELGHPGAVPRYQLNCLPTWIEQKTKVGKCILIFSLSLLRWFQWKIHLLPDHIIIITSGIYDVIASPWDFSFIWRHWNAYESTDYQLEQWLYSLAMPTRVIVVLWPMGRPAVYQWLYLLRHTQYSYVMIITVYFLYISLLATKVLLEDLSYLPTVWSD